MSVRVMAAVFDRYPNASEMLLALALADHAHDDGTHIFPSVASLAKKTRRSERAVQYQLRAMILSGWLVLDKRSTGRRGQTNAYVISEEWLAGGDPIPLATGANLAPVESVDNSETTGAISGNDGCNIEQSRVKPIAPKPSLIITNQTPLTPQGGQDCIELPESKAGAGTVTRKDASEGFELFWAAWPDNEGKQDYVLCLAIWQRKRLGRFVEEILADIAARRANSTRWQSGYVEAPRRYLKGSRWRDGVTYGVPTSAQHWSESRTGIEAMGEKLGLGRWDEAAFERTHAQAAMFHNYKARVLAEAERVGNGAH